jgi:hypothetical protein
VFARKAAAARGGRVSIKRAKKYLAFMAACEIGRAKSSSLTLLLLGAEGAGGVASLNIKTNPGS